MSVRVLIADDEQLVRSGFGMILSSEPDIDVVGEAADGREAIDLAQRLRVDVVLMDIRMPNLDGLQATRQILSTQYGNPPRVVVVTTFDGDEYVYEALRAGASGFLLKDTPPDDLISAVRVVGNGECLLAPSITTRLIEQFARRPDSSRLTAALESLSQRELEVLRLMARGLSNCEIGEALVLSETTVKTHVRHIFEKLDLRDRVQAVVVAYESGLVEPGVSA
jgi:DNA-binding NarL/FixJ family response regulator